MTRNLFKDEKTNLVTVDFHGNEIQAYKDNGGNIFVAVKFICEQLGLDFERQKRKISKDFKEHVIYRGVRLDRSLMMLNYKKLNMWLCRININHVKAEVRPLLQKYQEECAEVLYKYFNEGIAINERFFKDHAELKKEVLEIKSKIKSQSITDKDFLQDIIDKIDTFYYEPEIDTKFQGIKGFILRNKRCTIKQADFVNNVFNIKNDAVTKELEELKTPRYQRFKM